MSYVSNAVYIPVDTFDSLGLENELRVKYRRMGDDNTQEVEPWQRGEEHVAIPRNYGLKLISKIGEDVEDRMSYGFVRKYPVEVVHTGDYAYQDAFVRKMLKVAQNKTDFLISAATGKGKTVMALSVIQKLGVTAVVVVDQANLMDQWRERAKTVLGLSDDQIGVVVGPKCEYKGKYIVIAMMQSLVRRRYSDAFYDYFGVAVFDEAHTAGAPTFSQALMQFSAAVRFGVSATIDRRDALQKLLELNLGDVEAELTDKHDTSYVYYLESNTVYSWYANISPKTGRILSEVAEDTDRNSLIARAAKWLYESGRDVLLLSDRIDQLETLYYLCAGEGIPVEDLGIYCGYRTVWRYQKEASPKSRPEGWSRAVKYTPVALSPTQKKISKKDKEKVLESSRVILATYGMFAKGVDVPRLSGGIDCTPRSRAEQVHGRVLRVKEGKLVPIWVTIRDINSYRIDFQFSQRVKEYARSSAEIYQWKIEKGVRKKNLRDLVEDSQANVAELKKLKIVTQLDGNNTLTT